LGEFILTGLRRAAAGQVEVDVTFEINADGIVSVHAKDLETGQQQSITVTASSGLTRDEISTMMDQSRDFAVARRTSEESEQAKQEAERLIAEIEKLFPQVERVVAGSDFGRDAIDKARGVVARARTLIEAGDAAQLKEQLDALARTQRMFKGVVGKTA
jgi:molecular chaperone DnaK